MNYNFRTFSGFLCQPPYITCNDEGCRKWSVQYVSKDVTKETLENNSFRCASACGGTRPAGFAARLGLLSHALDDVLPELGEQLVEAVDSRVPVGHGVQQLDGAGGRAGQQQHLAQARVAQRQ